VPSSNQAVINSYTIIGKFTESEQAIPLPKEKKYDYISFMWRKNSCEKKEINNLSLCRVSLLNTNLGLNQLKCEVIWK